MRIAIISDLHCKHSSSDGPTKTTLLYSDDINGSPLTNPIKALKKLVEDEKIKCDLVLCPGDIADRADPQGLSTGWTYLESIQGATGSGLLLATVGNHDVNVKCMDKEDPNGSLKNFDTNYPVPNADGMRTQYWQDDYCLMKYDRTIILVFNSCHSHRNSSSSRQSHITIDQIAKISAELAKIDLSDYDYRIALCHHHPINHGNIDNPDIDLISNGEDLLTMLETFKFQVVIHGHKHEPRLSYRNSIAVFCAGSLSSTQNVYDLRIENTFHIMEILPGKAMGTIETWVLIPRKGWIQKSGTFFPCLTGFGTRTNIDDLAKKCVDWLKQEQTDLALFNTLKLQFPELAYLNPSDQELLNTAIGVNNAELTPEFPDRPKYIGLKILKDESV